MQAQRTGSILSGATTCHDSNLQTLCCFMAESGPTNAGYLTRVGHLKGSHGGGLNGLYFLKEATVPDDSAIDTLFASPADLLPQSWSKWR